jgi:hypothetical protein
MLAFAILIDDDARSTLEIGRDFPPSSATFFITWPCNQTFNFAPLFMSPCGSSPSPVLVAL